MKRLWLVTAVGAHWSDQGTLDDPASDNDYDLFISTRTSASR
jgi:hypothetical protein